MPVVAGGVCLAMVWLWIFDQRYGLLNHVTGSLLGLELDWLGRTDTALPSLAVVVISWSLGQPIIIFFGGAGRDSSGKCTRQRGLTVRDR
ncbi:MAG: hypothetical protein CM1200mP2_25200 [Planctomycetaceae bacterium]|nr:MAG: hypothetical protein CM1200mP2_25200 [Planctomycetaceae bacterium]